MILEGWLFVGLVAGVATYTTLTTTADDVGIVMGIIGLISWGLFAFQSLHVEVLGGGATDPVTYSFAAVTVWALVMAVANLYVVLEGPVAVIDQRGRASDEVTQ